MFTKRKYYWILL